MCLMLLGCTTTEFDELHGTGVDESLPETIYAAIDSDITRIELNASNKSKHDQTFHISPYKPRFCSPSEG